MLDPASTVVIANPAAAGGRVGRRWEALAAQLDQALGPVQQCRTQAPGHARQLAAQAVRDGAKELLSLGGDGTHNEVVNGIMDAEPQPGAVTLGILPVGTGGDFRRNLAHARTLDEALAHLAQAPVHRVDLGRCDFLDDDGHQDSRWFVNMASCGVSGLVCRKVNASSKRLGGKPIFFLASLSAMLEWRGSPVRIQVDGQVVAEELTITTLAAANGRWAGGGMMFAPDARLGDGLLDLVALEYTGIVGALSISGPLYDGRHLSRDDVHHWRGRHIQVTPLDPQRTAFVEIDGEPPGTVPATFEVAPAMLGLRDLRPELA